MYLKRIIALICFLYAFNLNAQTNEKDSLLKLLRVYRQDTNCAKTYYHLAKYYEKNNLDSAKYFLRLLGSLAEKLSYERGRYLYHERVAVVSFTQGAHHKALEESRKGLMIARHLKQPGFEIAMLNMMSICYQYLGRYQEELDYVLQAQAKAEKVKDTAKMVGLYISISNAYADLGQHRKSLDAGLTGLRLRKRYNITAGYVNRLYAGIAQEYEILGLPDSAIYFYDKALSSSKQLNDRFAEASIYKYITNFYSSLGKYDKMREMAAHSLALAREMNSRQLLATAYYNLAAAHYYTRDNRKALAYVKQALSIAKADSIRHEMQNGYRLLSYISATQGDFITSSNAQRKADSLERTALNEEVAKSAADLEKKYETEKKDSQIRLQQAAIKQKNTLNYILIGGALLLILIFAMVYRNYKHRQKIQQQRINELETEKQLTATEAVLKGEEQERTRLAKDLHDGLGGMLSGLKHSFGHMQGNLVMTPENAMAFNRSMDMLDSSIKEMRRIAHNMMPEALVKFGLDTALRDFCTDINLTGALQVDYQSIGMETANLDNTTSITIFRIVQELLNNTIKHASADTAIVQLAKSDDTITVTVEDDGKGFNPDLLTETHGIGWANMKNRVDFLKGKIDVKTEPDKGTSVLIEFKL